MKKLFFIFIVIFTTNAFAYITEDIVGGCNYAQRFHPVFEINTYTCQPGYFLPADTLGCQPCPTGHTCSGGTFNYNPTMAQGIKFNRPTSANVTNGCSTNFGTKLVPRFVPNNVNITWDNGDGNTSTTTCTYNDIIVLPTEPTRPGYVFMGWKLQENN